MDDWYICEDREMEIVVSIPGDNRQIFNFFCYCYDPRDNIKLRGHRGFNPESSSPESPVCTTAVHYHKMTREMVVYKSVWTQRHKKHQRLGNDPGYRSVQGLSRDLRSPNAIF